MVPGAKWTIDLEQVTIREFRNFAKGNLLSEEDDAILAKATGMTVEEIGNLPQPTYRRLLRDFFQTAQEPLNDPN